jgi:hypothetical protein
MQIASLEIFLDWYFSYVPVTTLYMLLLFVVTTFYYTVKQKINKPEIYEIIQ